MVSCGEVLFAIPFDPCANLIITRSHSFWHHQHHFSRKGLRNYGCAILAVSGRLRALSYLSDPSPVVTYAMQTRSKKTAGEQ